MHAQQNIIDDHGICEVLVYAFGWISNKHFPREKNENTYQMAVTQSMQL